MRITMVNFAAHRTLKNSTRPNKEPNVMEVKFNMTVSVAKMMPTQIPYLNKLVKMLVKI